ncbi:MAG: hypothetical protein ACTSWC_00805 [Promethearchaeota archaeon]
MVDSLQLSKLHQKLQHFFPHPLDVEIIFYLLQHGIMSVKNLQHHIFPNQNSKKPQLYRRLKNLKKQGWIIQIGTHPLKYTIIDKNLFREMLNSEIEQTVSHLQAQKSSFYDIVTIIDAINAENKGDSSKNVLYHSIPSHASNFAVKLIDKIQKSSNLQIFNGEYGITITINNEQRQFRLTALEFIKEQDPYPLFGGIFLAEVHPESRQDQIIQFLHQYHINGIKFRYKLERKGYIEEKTRNLSQYQIMKQDPAKNNFNFSNIQGSEFNIMEIILKDQKFIGYIFSYPFVIESNSTHKQQSPKYVTIWGESGEIFNVLSKVLLNFK